MAPATPVHVIISAFPHISHFIPLQNIARHLVLRGYGVTFLCTPATREAAEAMGATYVPIPSVPDFDDDELERQSLIPTTRLTEEGLAPSDFLDYLFLSTIAPTHAALQEILASHPNSIILTDPMMNGVTPSQLGAPGPRPKGVICIGLLPLSVKSIDISPALGDGSILDPSPEGRIRNAMLYEKEKIRRGPQSAYFHRLLARIGATQTTELGPLDANYLLADIHLQLCPPSLEYPRSDGLKDMRFTGGLPRREAVKAAGKDLPEWWADVSTNPGNKRIVAVSQGTLANTASQLIIPTMEGLAEMEDVLVVVALGKKGATLPEDFKVPANARVADWIPFDDLLGYSDIFVSNGGYGGFQNAIARGVPLVIAPLRFADKMDIAARVRWAGVGVDIGEGEVTGEKVRAAVEEVFRERKYKERVLEIKKEIESFDPMDVIVGAIEDLAARA